jgi:predicted DCC family thiol-disulfide oxidoreductase YuxK
MGSIPSTHPNAVFPIPASYIKVISASNATPIMNANESGVFGIALLIVGAPDGSLVRGMEVFRRAYDAVGLGWLLAPTRWPILRSIFDAGYSWFARNRLRLTGRTGTCDSGRCRIP